MKEGIHPAYDTTRVVCACGHSWEVGSTVGKPEMRVEICSACHPFFTGAAAKLIDTEGRVERFNKKYAKFAKAPAK